jgi:hypothetical protein
MKYELRGEKKLVRVELDLPKGTKGALFANGGKHPLNEFLLPRGSAFKIHEVKEYGDEVIVRASLTNEQKLNEARRRPTTDRELSTRFIWTSGELEI